MFSHASIFDHVCTCSTFLISRPLRTLEHAQQELGRKITDFDRRLQYKIEHDTAKREAPYGRAANVRFRCGHYMFYSDGKILDNILLE